MFRKLACLIVVGGWALTATPAVLADGDPTDPYEGPGATTTTPQSVVVESALWLIMHTGSVLWVGP